MPLPVSGKPTIEIFSPADLNPDFCIPVNPIAIIKVANNHIRLIIKIKKLPKFLLATAMGTATIPLSENNLTKDTVKCQNLVGLKYFIANNVNKGAND
jgi:hypothetical protein